MKYVFPAIDGYAKMTVTYEVAMKTGNIYIIRTLGEAIACEDESRNEVLPESFVSELYYLIANRVRSRDSQKGQLV
jgi:hypothetical protein